jgi:transcriptional regulator with GAF, ATPase, and Fis domain
MKCESETPPENRPPWETGFRSSCPPRLEILTNALHSCFVESPGDLASTLARISLRIARSLDRDEVLGEITRGLVRELDAALARIWLVKGQVLELVASAGLSESREGSRSRVPVGSLKIGQIAETRAPVCTSDLRGDARFVDQAWIEAHGLRGFAGYPLLYGEELLGVLAIFTRHPIVDREADQLAILAAQASIAIKNASLFAAVHALTSRLEAENTYLREELEGAAGPSGIVGRSTALDRVLAELERVAPTSSTVLLLGETGTGKELFARAVHDKSTRRTAPLVKVNCAALTPSLVESELFGHERGAFTGATQRRVGRFELAQDGTLFLDEIGELPLEPQAKLLRVLQEHEMERVGGTQTIKVIARIVAASNRDLAADVRAGRFRADLYYRLAVFPITIPPLRDRREDIPLLASTFLEGLAARHAGARPKRVAEDALLYLQTYEWPGNVRELHNVLERASILATKPVIELSDLPELTNASTAEVGLPTSAEPLKERVHAYERSLLLEALRLAEDNQSEAARLLQTSRATLQYKMRIHGL